MKRRFSVKKNGRNYRVEGDRLRFCIGRCFDFESSKNDRHLIEKLVQHFESLGSKGIFFGSRELYEYFQSLDSRFEHLFSEVLLDDWAVNLDQWSTLPFSEQSDFTFEPVDPSTRWIFIGDTVAHRIEQRKRCCPSDQAMVDLSILPELDSIQIPKQAWVYDSQNIYPLTIPDIQVEKNLDLLLLDCPARNLALMPNGLAYVHNALKPTGIQFQTLDLDILTYHHFHFHRLHDRGGKVFLPNGLEIKEDPWTAENYDEWSKKEVVQFFDPVIQRMADQIIKAKPKILALSLQDCNRLFSSQLVERVKAELDEIVILVGGYLCYQPEIGRKAFPECDYMCIGEADLTIGPLVKDILAGHQPKHLPGVASKFDDPDWTVRSGPMPNQLDELEMARYDWTDLNLYRNHNHYQLTPIIASRGCRWSKCTFCAERFFWRVRSPRLVVDEFEYLSDHGCDLFMFNESDLNGRPEILLEICDEIIRRGLKVKLTGQLRINKKSDRAFFDKLRAAGFLALRFGVDAWAANTLKLQKKGYTVPMISRNLRDCHEAGIFSEVNTVIGVPGETEQDIDQTIELKIQNKPYIGRLANINTLMLVPGSVYWEKPEAFGIKFKMDQADLVKKYPRMVPEEFWYSESPFIDGDVRRARFNRVVSALNDGGFDMGAFAQKVIGDVQEGKENSPTAAARPKAKPFGETQILAASRFRVSDQVEISEQSLIRRHSSGYYAIPSNEAMWEPSSRILFIRNAIKTLFDEGASSFYDKAQDRLKQILEKDRPTSLFEQPK